MVVEIRVTGVVRYEKLDPFLRGIRPDAEHLAARQFAGQR